jgi:YgiT-type zinc finger domain-containing protein
MAKRPCPYCKNGQLVIKTVEHSARPISDSIIVKEKIHQCDSCGGQVFSAKERKRWTDEVLRQVTPK